MPKILKVSCIMPTKNRAHFVRKSIKMFKNQSYPNKELVIIDDSDEPQNIKTTDEIQYIHYTNSCSIGSKRNIGISRASGDVILLWDDDDYHGSDRIANQLAALVRSKKHGIVYNTCVYYNLPSETMYVLPQKIHNELWKYGYIAGTFMFYKKLFTIGIKFKNQNFREDILFIEDILNRGFKIATFKIPAGDFVYVKHDASSMKVNDAYAHKTLKISKKDFYSL